MALGWRARSSSAIKVWDTLSGNELTNLRFEGGSPVAVAWSPDGERVAACANGPVRVWEVRSGKELPQLSEGGFKAVSWSPDARRLAALGEGLVQLWDARAGENW